MAAAIRQWSAGDVCAWLQEAGLDTFAASFAHHGIDGAVLLRLDEEQLSELGLTSKV